MERKIKRRDFETGRQREVDWNEFAAHNSLSDILRPTASEVRTLVANIVETETKQVYGRIRELEIEVAELKTKYEK